MSGHAQVFGFTSEEDEDSEELESGKPGGCTPIPFPCGPREERHFACEGKAELTVPHAGLRIRGSILDLGCSGCFVHAPALNLERGTHVEVLLETHQISVRVAGCISSFYPHLGVCVAFAEMSVRTRRVLDALVTELEEAREGISSNSPAKISAAGSGSVSDPLSEDAPEGAGVA